MPCAMTSRIALFLFLKAEGNGHSKAICHGRKLCFLISGSYPSRFCIAPQTLWSALYLASFVTIPPILYDAALFSLVTLVALVYR